MIEGGRQDRAFIDSYCEGWEDFRADIEAADWESLECASGIDRDQLRAVADIYGACERAVFAWGMGMTHHAFGCDNVEYIANLALLRGMVGRRYAGLLPLRGHSNVQGIGTIGVKPVLPEAVFARLEETLETTFPRARGLDTLAALEAAHAGAIDAEGALGRGGAQPDPLQAIPDHHPEPGAPLRRR